MGLDREIKPSPVQAQPPTPLLPQAAQDLPLYVLSQRSLEALSPDHLDTERRRQSTNRQGLARGICPELGRELSHAPFATTTPESTLAKPIVEQDQQQSCGERKRNAFQKMADSLKTNAVEAWDDLCDSASQVRQFFAKLSAHGARLCHESWNQAINQIKTNILQPAVDLFLKPLQNLVANAVDELFEVASEVQSKFQKKQSGEEPEQYAATVQPSLVNSEHWFAGGQEASEAYYQRLSQAQAVSPLSPVLERQECASDLIARANLETCEARRHQEKGTEEDVLREEENAAHWDESSNELILSELESDPNLDQAVVRAEIRASDTDGTPDGTAGRKSAGTIRLKAARQRPGKLKPEPPLPA